MHRDHAASDRHPCEWIRVASGCYAREQDTREKMILRQVRGVPDRINYYMLFSVKLRYTMSDAEAESRVRGAWISLRCNQPSIGLIAEGTQMRCSVLEPDGVNAWVSRTFSVHTSAKSALALSSDLYPAAGMELHFLPLTQEVLMCASHENVDGHGLVMLLDRLCSLIAFPSQPKFENQAERLSPPLDIAAAVGNASPRMWEWSTDVLREWKAREAHPLLMAADLPGPGASGVSTIRLVLSNEDSSKIFRFAKANKVSVNDLMNGTVIMAVKQHGSLKEGSWLGGVVMDARPLCKHPFNTWRHAATIYFVTCPAYVENPKSIVDAARQIQQQRLAFQRDPEALHILQPLLKAISIRGDNSHNHRPQTSSPTSVEYSGLGRLDGHLQQVHGNLEIIDFWMTIGHQTEAVGVYCYTYRGRLRFTLSYNSGFHTQGSMSLFMRVLESMLRDSLLTSSNRRRGG
ncbi:benzoate 4-monooxygenase cytochrome p450 [Colletotrichum incanum]|uniref:Benzoate 4-monooxygenase cytochrome p450 n=1 Tax=Colletotrichum incanum TaxID=1573173 RepID=A0A167CIW6_COLIC|nr:benzoate 4-monooxygenase cytochrome p450 [Colletotrichum incanum]